MSQNAERNFDYGDLLPEFSGAITAVERVERLKDLYARRVPPIRYFMAIARNHYHTPVTPEQYLAGLTLLVAAKNELAALQLAFNGHALTDTLQDAELFRMGAKPVLSALFSAYRDAVEVIQAMPESRAEELAANFSALAEPLAAVRGVVLPELKAVPSKSAAKTFNELLAYAAPGEIASAYQAEAAQSGEASGPRNKKIMKQIEKAYSQRLREDKALLAKEKCRSYGGYLSEVHGIPPGVVKKMLDPRASFTQVEMLEADELVLLQAQENQNCTQNIGDVIAAYRAFSPELGDCAHQLLEQRQILQTQVKNEYAGPFTHFTDGTVDGKSLLMIYAPANSQVLPTAAPLAHETGHAIDHDRAMLHPEGSKGDDVVMAELIAHVGEYLLLDYRMQNEPDAENAIRLAKRYLGVEGLSQQIERHRLLTRESLLTRLPHFGQDISGRNIAQAYHANKSMLDPMTVAHATLEPVNSARLYHEGGVRLAAYPFARLGARAFAQKLMNAGPDERAAMAGAWEKVMTNTADYNWATALEAVGIDCRSPDFMETAMDFPKRYLEAFAEKRDVKLPARLFKPQSPFAETVRLNAGNASSDRAR